VNIGSLSEAAGLMAGDTILRVDKVDALRLRHQEALDLITKSGNQFQLLVSRWVLFLFWFLSNNGNCWHSLETTDHFRSLLLAVTKSDTPPFFFVISSTILARFIWKYTYSTCTVGYKQETTDKKWGEKLKKKEFFTLFLYRIEKQVTDDDTTAYARYR